MTTSLAPLARVEMGEEYAECKNDCYGLKYWYGSFLSRSRVYSTAWMGVCSWGRLRSFFGAGQYGCVCVQGEDGVCWF